MKNLKYYITLLLTTILLVSCEEKLDELNVDPSNPRFATPELAFPAGVMSTASVVGGRYAIVGGIWSQYYTQNNASNQYKHIDGFYYIPSDFANQWQELYAGALNDLKYVKKESSKAGKWNLFLMATVIEAYTYQVLTDLHGDIPFREALRGDEGFTNPHYDDSQSVYDSLIIRLDDALSKDFAAKTNKEVGKADFVFGTSGTSDLNKWKQFANTLKLKIFLRQINARPSVAEAGVKALYTSGAKFLTDDAALKVFEDAPSKSNPLFEQDQRQLNTKENLRASKTLFNFLQAASDPRLDTLYLPGTTGQKPMEQGNYNAPSTTVNPLTFSRAFLDPTDPVYFISKAESLFLQAEAVERGWGPGGTAEAKNLYDAGVTESFSRYGMEADAPAFLAGEYEYGTYYDNDKIGNIIIQKWISMALTRQGIESFFDRMRTGYPKTTELTHASGSYEGGYIVYPKEGVTSGKFAARFFYPDTEKSRNPNTPTQPDLWDPLWWHKP